MFIRVLLVAGKEKKIRNRNYIEERLL